MLEQSLIVFLRITANYLNECTNKDRLLLIALEHLVHLLLFSDELCLEAIRVSFVEISLRSIKLVYKILALKSKVLKCS